MAETVNSSITPTTTFTSSITIPSLISFRQTLDVTACETSFRKIADVNGNGQNDVINFTESGVAVQFSTDLGLTSPVIWARAYTEGIGGWDIINKHPVTLADVNGDGLADVVGFGGNQVYVSLSTGKEFLPLEVWVNGYGYNLNGGNWKLDRHLRLLADVNGDGMSDIIGFKDDGVYVSLSTGSNFTEPQKWLNRYGYDQGWFTEKHHRLIGDVNGDGQGDIVAFGNDGVYVSLSTGSSFLEPQTWINEFGSEINGWNMNSHNRFLVDVNDDGKMDILSERDNLVYVSYSDGSRFLPPVVEDYSSNDLRCTFD